MSIVIPKDKELIELDLLINTVRQLYGWDFNHYKKESLRRSAKRLVSRSNLQHISELIPILVWDENSLDELVCSFSIPVTEMFRDPNFFLELRKTVIPILKTYPFIKVWHAGCASGDEVYSMAILLQEEGMYERSRIYGTDINPRFLQHAKDGIFDVEKLEKNEINYKNAGGKGKLSDYFHLKYDACIFNKDLKKNICFFNHNIVNDSSFGEMNLILCRNVLIYFDKEFQNKAIGLFNESLCYGGFLCLGMKESIDFLEIKTELHPYNNKLKIYRKGIE